MQGRGGGGGDRCWDLGAGGMWGQGRWHEECQAGHGCAPKKKLDLDELTSGELFSLQPCSIPHWPLQVVVGCVPVLRRQRKPIQENTGQELGGGQR